MSNSLWAQCTALLLAACVSVGCGGTSDPVAETSQGDAGAAGNASLAAAQGSSPQPSEAEAAATVVKQFLDRVRLGGPDSRADEFLTNTARNEINRVGGVQTLGAPEARFLVTRSQPAPDESGGIIPGAMLVQSVWIETSDDLADQASPDQPQTSETQVVWAVQKELDQWRISGMAIELAPDQPPTIIDFENRQQLAQLFGQMEPVAPAVSAAGGQIDAPQQAALPGQGYSR